MLWIILITAIPAAAAASARSAAGKLLLLPRWTTRPAGFIHIPVLPVLLWTVPFSVPARHRQERPKPIPVSRPHAVQAHLHRCPDCSHLRCSRSA